MSLKASHIIRFPDPYLRWVYLAGMILYIVISLVFFTAYVPELCTDTIAYLNIAKKYSEGHIGEAINAYWSPLLSWLLVPFYWIGVDPFTSFRLINLFSGIAVLALSIRIMDRFQLSVLGKIFCFYTLCVFAFYYQATSATPDFLSVFFVMLFVFNLSNPNRYSDRFFFLKTGSAAVLAFFCKGYFLFFFGMAIFLFNTADWVISREHRKVVLLNFIRIVGIFVGALSIWVLLLSNKYDRFIISSGGTYNFSLIQEGKDIGYKPQYYYDSGLIPPPDRWAVSSWEDPTYYPIKTRSMFTTPESFRFQIEVVNYNLPVLGYLFRWFSWLGLVLIFMLLAVPILSNRSSKETVTVFIFSALLYLLGYLMLFYEERYTLPSYFILILCAFFVADEGLTRLNIPFAVKVIGMIFFSIAFLKNPWKSSQEMSPALKQVEEYRSTALALKQTSWLYGKKIASRFEFEVTGLISFYNRASYYGMISEKKSEEENAKELIDNGIDYFFYFNCYNPFTEGSCRDSLPAYLRDKPIVYSNNRLKLQVVKLR